MNSESLALKRSLTLPLMALWLPVEMLARATSLLLLVVFALINQVLWIVQRKSELTQKGFSAPRWIAVAGFTA